LRRGGGRSPGSFARAPKPVRLRTASSCKDNGKRGRHASTIAKENYFWVIQSQVELGIEATFWKEEEEAISNAPVIEAVGKPDSVACEPKVESNLPIAFAFSWA
jgi:hypothetical protein